MCQGPGVGTVEGRGSLSRAGWRGARPSWEQMPVPAQHSLTSLCLSVLIYATKTLGYMSQSRVVRLMTSCLQDDQLCTLHVLTSQGSGGALQVTGRAGTGAGQGQGQGRDWGRAGEEPREPNARRPRSQRGTGAGLAPASEASLHLVPCAPPLPTLTVALPPGSLWCWQVCRRR